MTEKQEIILNLLRRGNEDGDFLDIGQLRERLPYRCSRQAVVCSLDFLIAHGLVEKKGLELRRGRARQVVGLTPQGYSVLSSSG